MTKENREMESKLTKYTNTQLNITWDTKQTLGQYLEILKDNETEYDEELFLEYVASNFLEWIRESTDKDILREIIILNDDAEELV
jgi:adenylate cyclase class IV